MSDETVKQYQDQLEAIVESLNRKFTAVTTSARDSSSPTQPAVLQQILTEAEADVYDGKQVISKLEAEIRQLPYNLRSRLASSYSPLRKRFEEQQYRLTQFKDILKTPSSSINNFNNNSNKNMASDQANWREQRQRLLGTKQTLDDADASLDRTTRALIETAEAGVATTISLQQQREALLRSQDNLKQTDDFLARSKRTLNRMRRRLMTNKLIQSAIILLELGILGLIIYLKYYR